MRWRRVAGLSAVGLAVAIPVAFVALPLVARAFVRGIVLMLKGCVWLAISLAAGRSLSGVAGTVARNAAGALETPIASAILIGLLAAGVVAAYALQRLLGAEQEESIE